MRKCRLGECRNVRGCRPVSNERKRGYVQVTTSTRHDYDSKRCFDDASNIPRKVNHLVTLLLTRIESSHLLEHAPRVLKFLRNCKI